MQLEIGTGLRIDDPSASQIAHELAALPGGIDSYAILSQDDLTYLQTAGGSSDGFSLEYQEGSIDRHYRSPQNDLPLATVIRAFQLYAAQDSSWRSLVAWERDDLRPHASGLAPRVLGIVVAMAALAFLWVRCAVS